jgi:hypothetical protein
VRPGSAELRAHKIKFLNFVFLYANVMGLCTVYISLKGILTEKCKVGGRVADELYERLSHHLRYPRET